MKLTLRELFLLVALVAIGLGWWIDRSRLANQVATFQTALQSEYLRGASDEDARWFQVIEHRSDLDDTTKTRIRREYLKQPGSGLPRPMP